MMIFPFYLALVLNDRSTIVYKRCPPDDGQSIPAVLKISRANFFHCNPITPPHQIGCQNDCSDEGIIMTTSLFGLVKFDP